MARQRHRPSRRPYAVLLVTFAVALAFGLASGGLAAYLRSAPSLDEIRFDAETVTYFYDRYGDEIATRYREHRIPVTIDQVPQSLKDAVVAIEDRQFYNHHGVNVAAIVRAVVADLRAGAKVQGGSTITQQLAKNVFLTHDKTFTRKLREVLWAIQIERKYAKEEILEAYLNEIYWGPGIYGVQAASQFYFGKPVSELTLAESALLAGIIRNPGTYSPITRPEAAVSRRNLVLEVMAELGYITPREMNLAKAQPVELAAAATARTSQAEGRASDRWFVQYVMRQLVDKYHISYEEIYQGGLRVYTTLDPAMQQAAEQAMTYVDSLSNERDANGLRKPQAALVALDPATGAIRAMIGGRDGDEFNRAWQAYRQPGSANKVFVYTAAIDSQRFTPATMLVDEPVEYPKEQLPEPLVAEGRAQAAATEEPADPEMWRPRNHDDQYRGPVTLRDALADSINVVAIKLLDQLGIPRAINLAQKMGITSLNPEDRHLGFAIGGLTRGVTPMEMAEAYGVLANQGIHTEPFAVVKVTDASGMTLWETQPQREIVLDAATAYLVTDMLRDVVERGTGKNARIPGRDVAGKTGTTNEFTDAWFVGYTPELVAAVWIGNDQASEPMLYQFPNRDPLRIGSAGAAELWRRFASRALENVPASTFARPPGLVDGVPIDVKTGLLVDDGCAGIPRAEIRQEIFLQGTQPVDPSPRCQPASPFHFLWDWFTRGRQP
ncbi:transglycosylase domain-containing protein [Limnochorda pilosa]|uniref:Penicillin-binding protein 1A n=1 Tax=Limnochorda pilosa TaxID=1555112 RepID=A0A0K2SMU4_LIMPI|nr:PBP1A family penicillin-binding protein [Limnochorda pilosa]BAS28327.1 penicillin-binding protein 1A [Limnochorda pilosa]